MKSNFANLAADVSVDMIIKEHRTVIHYFMHNKTNKQII